MVVPPGLLVGELGVVAEEFAASTSAEVTIPRNGDDNVRRSLRTLFLSIVRS
jgi:hypothetical protein